jgi:hypothetical protein
MNYLIVVSCFFIWLLWIDMEVWVFEMLVLMLPPGDAVLLLLPPHILLECPHYDGECQTFHLCGWLWNLLDDHCNVWNVVVCLYAVGVDKST